MTDAETDDDVEVKPQQTADASQAPAGTPAPPPGPSAFSQSQDTWKNPFETAVSSMPSIDYNKAITDRQAVLKNEIRDVNAITNRNATDSQRLGNAAEAKNAQIQAVNPNQLSTWDAKAKQEQYSTSPFEAYGSFAMIASLGMAAFTRAPMTASLNAMAGVMTGLKEGNDQAYERDYNAWKANNDVLMKRFGIMKDQLSSDMEVWKQKGASGATDLSNTLLKYGLYKDQALVDNGLVEPVETAMMARFKAVEGMRKASEEVETQHAIRQAITTEEAQRKELGLPMTTPQERADIKAGIEKPGTPAEIAFREGWKKFHQEEPNASSERMAEKKQELQYNSRTAATKAADDLIDSMKKVAPDWSEGESAMVQSAMAAKGVRAAAGVARVSEVLDQIKARAADGNPMPAAERAAALRKAVVGVQAEGSGTAVDIAARKWLRDQLTPAGSAAFKEQVQGRAAQINDQEKLIPPDELTKRAQQFRAQMVGIQRFQSGPQGNTVRSISVVMDHIATIDELGKALKNGDFVLANRLRQTIAAQAGSMDPTNVEVAAHIVGPELIKALGITSAGTGAERMEAALNWSRNASPQQFSGASETAKRLLAGQLDGLKRQFKVATGLPEQDFDSMLSPAALEGLKGKAGAGETPPASLLKEGVSRPIIAPDGTSRGYWTLIRGVPTKVDR